MQQTFIACFIRFENTLLCLALSSFVKHWCFWQTILYKMRRNIYLHFKTNTEHIWWTFGWCLFRLYVKKKYPLIFKSFPEKETSFETELDTTDNWNKMAWVTRVRTKKTYISFIPPTIINSLSNQNFSQPLIIYVGK